jgi:two-component system sensor histidine kinase/response regulator
VVFNDYANAPNKHGLPEGHAELIAVPDQRAGDRRRQGAHDGRRGQQAEPYTDLDVETVQLIANTIWRMVHQHRSIKPCTSAKNSIALPFGLRCRAGCHRI